MNDCGGRRGQRESGHAGSFVLSFYFSLRRKNLSGGLKGVFQQNSHQFSRCALSGSWSLPIGQ